MVRHRESASRYRAVGQIIADAEVIRHPSGSWSHGPSTGFSEVARAAVSSTTFLTSRLLDRLWDATLAYNSELAVTLGLAVNA